MRHGSYEKREEYIYFYIHSLFLYLWSFRRSDATLPEQRAKQTGKSEWIMSSTKRIILAHGSRLVREMLHHALDKAEQLQIVDEVPDREGLPLSIETFAPEWVILPLPYSSSMGDWIDTCSTGHPSVGFVFVSPHQNQIKMKWQTSCEEEYSDLSLKEFIQILEKDPQHI
jgi:hypothetical protein